MGAGPPKGNKNAEVWDLKKAKRMFNKAVKLTKQKEESGAFKYDFIGEIAAELGTYKDFFNHMLIRFPELKPLKNLLDTNIEQNCYYNSKKGNIREATAIVNLKSNWKWTDRQDHTSGGEPLKPPKIEFKK